MPDAAWLSTLSLLSQVNSSLLESLETCRCPEVHGTAGQQAQWSVYMPLLPTLADSNSLYDNFTLPPIRPCAT